MKRNMLTSEERSKILDLRKKGHSFNGISRETKRSVDTVRKFIKDPEGYTRIVNSYYKELKSITPKKKVLKSITPKKKVINKAVNKKVKKVTKAKSNTLKDVNLEHRAVIKFLTKQGQTVTQIFSNLKKVYTNAVLDYDSVKFWCYEYKNGRETLLNEASPKKSNSIKNSVKKSKTTIKKSKTTIKKSKKTTPKKPKTAAKSKTVYIWKAKPKKSAIKLTVKSSAAKKMSATIEKKLTQVKKILSESSSSSVQTANNIEQGVIIKEEPKTAAPVKKNLFQIKLLPISKKILS